MITLILIWASALSAAIAAFCHFGYFGYTGYKYAYLNSFVILALFLIWTHFKYKGSSYRDYHIGTARTSALILITLGPIGLPEDINAIIICIAALSLFLSAFLYSKNLYALRALS